MRIAGTIGWLLREMIDEGGGFAASLDADSEGEEGKFYVWSLDDVLSILGEEDRRYLAQAYDVSAGGNFEGHNILNRLNSMTLRSEKDEARLGKLRAKLMT